MDHHHDGLAATILPEDLEREIFEISAHSRPVFIPTLMLVARRVKIWVEPLLYRTIVLQTAEDQLEGYPTHSWDTLSIILKSTPASFFLHAVRNLYLMASDRHKMLLTHCRAIENLWIGGSPIELPEIFPLIEDLPLQQLYCNLTYLFGPQRQIDFTHQLFARIARLEVFDHRNSFNSTIWGNLAIIPHLTHLAFNEPISIAMWLSLLRGCHSLRVFVVLGQFLARAKIDGHQDKEELVKEPRFVVMDCDQSTQDWQMGAHLGIDYWSRAEDFIAKRRSGEIDPLRYWVEEDESLESS
ncbi:hypothetical protein B0H19DRAFT_1374774 [Mycena capillaripes]|nr:hypothetical protein B0H19DRAFT_1374774 [Mycena capillaripes]